MLDCIKVNTKVQQGCLLPPFLFLLAIDWVMKSTTQGKRNGMQWTFLTQLDDLDFADELAFLSHSHTQMQDKTSKLEKVSAGIRLKAREKQMRINIKVVTPITVGGEPLQDVE